MKRFLTGALCALLALSAFTGCSGGDDRTLKVGATPTPHAEILEQAVPLMEERGYTLEIEEFNDYILPNTALSDGELDANYFQHITYLETFNEEQGTDLVSAGLIHFEPMGIYAGRVSSLEDLPDGGVIAVPNDTSNEGRPLMLLEENGLITLAEGADTLATVRDIVENPKNLQIEEIEAAQLVRALPDVDLAVINGNYALQGGLAVGDAVVSESAESEAVAEHYANVIAVRAGEENDEKIQALVEVLKSDEIRDFIDANYSGSVIAIQ